MTGTTIGPQGIDLGIDGIGPGTHIGEGGFGVVYRARQLDLDRDVAVKLLHASSADETTARRFDRERRALAVLSEHPNIVTVFRSGVSATGRLYLVMEYVGGGSLADVVVRNGRLEWREVAAFGAKLADALAAAHARDILHRDVKPENVLLSVYGEPQLADFGIAHLHGATSGSTSGTLSGSLLHAAPEVLDGHRASPASDVYSLASTLLTLLIGRPPFCRTGDESVTPVLARIYREPPPDLRGFGVPDALCTTLEVAMAKSAGDRVHDAASMADELRSIAAGSPRRMAAGRAAGATAATSAARRATTEAAPPAIGRRGRAHAVAALVTAVVILVAGAVLAAVLVRGGDDANGGGQAIVATSAVAPTTAAATAPPTSPTTAVAPSTTAAPPTTATPTTAAPPPTTQTTSPPVTTAPATTAVPVPLAPPPTLPAEANGEIRSFLVLCQDGGAEAVKVPKDQTAEQSFVARSRQLTSASFWVAVESEDTEPSSVPVSLVHDGTVIAEAQVSRTADGELRARFDPAVEVETGETYAVRLTAPDQGTTWVLACPYDAFDGTATVGRAAQPGDLVGVVTGTGGLS